MIRLIGFILFWISLGMLLMMLISSTLVGIIVIILFMIIGFNLYFCK